jgi:hypothetical protein
MLAEVCNSGKTQIVQTAFYQQTPNGQEELQPGACFQIWSFVSRGRLPLEFDVSIEDIQIVDLIDLNAWLENKPSYFANIFSPTTQTKRQIGRRNFNQISPMKRNTKSRESEIDSSQPPFPP